MTNFSEHAELIEAIYDIFSDSQVAEGTAEAILLFTAGLISGSHRPLPQPTNEWFEPAREGYRRAKSQPPFFSNGAH